MFPTRLCSFVFRLYSFVPPGMSFPLGSCNSFVLVCTRLYSFVFRLYSLVPLGMLFSLSICIPFVFVCTLTPFGEYNTIRRREEYKSTKMRKCDPSIVLGARWPNGITTARPLQRHRCARQAKERGRACVRGCVCVCLLKRSVFISPHCQRRGSNTETDLRSDATSKPKGGAIIQTNMNNDLISR